MKKKSAALSPISSFLLLLCVALAACQNKQQPRTEVESSSVGSQAPKVNVQTPKTDDRCAFLDTRVDVSTEVRGKIDGSLDSLYKVAKANGDIEGTKKQVVHNLQQDVPIAGQDLIQIRAQYLFCAVWGTDPNIDPTKKAELYQVIMKIPNSSSAPVSPTTSPDSTASSHPPPTTE